MSYLKERVSYLKGLAEGMRLDDSSNEGKLLKAILEVLDDIALTVSDIEDVQEQLSEQIDVIDEDLSDVEKVLFVDDEDEDEDDDDEDCDDDECECGEDAEVECPYCKKVFTIDDDLIDDDNETIECPNCHEKIDIDWECECCDCSDDSHHHHDR